MSDAYHRWDFRTQKRHEAIIRPDGCRDLLVITDKTGKRTLQITDWDLRPRKVILQPGSAITGYRLRPGTVIDAKTLRDFAADHDDPTALLDEMASEISDIIATLAAPDGDVAKAARAAGVTPRSVQRRFHAKGYPPPGFWQLLGRARRAAAALGGAASLADIAYDSGYSDQPHMTRAFAYWFGVTPARVAGDDALQDTFRQPALGNWTGEQISIR